MSELINTLKNLLGDTVALKFLAHGYHWNVETDDFPQYHDFFADIYAEYEAGIDPMAEWIRMLGDFAPFKLSRLTMLSSIPETETTSDHEEMAMNLYKVNEPMIAKFAAAGDMANAEKQYGLANFFADRQTTHQKLSWMLRASCSEMLAEEEMSDEEELSQTITE